MRYIIKKETKPTLQTFGKYKAVAVHYQTIESDKLIKETAQRTGFSEGNIIGVLMSVAEVVNSHLREGDRVRLPEWGMMKLHFIPESYEGSQPLYEGITYEKDKNFNDE